MTFTEQAKGIDLASRHLEALAIAEDGRPLVQLDAGHPAGDRRVDDRKLAALARVALEHPDDEARGQRSQADEEPALPARGAGEEREGRAGVVHAHDVEERGDGAAVAELEVAEDQRLGELVEQDDGQRDAQPGQQRGTGAGAVSCYRQRNQTYVYNAVMLAVSKPRHA